MRTKRKRRGGISAAHIIVLVALLVVVAYLYVNRRNKLPGPATRPGWRTYGDIVNTYDIHIDVRRLHQVWYATSEGLKRYDRRRGRWDTWDEARGLAGGQVAAVDGNGGDTLWLATWYGVAALNLRTDSIAPLPLPATVLAKRIFTVADDESTLWIGTDGRGIYRYDVANRTAERFTEQDGMAENAVYAFCMNDTAVWAGGSGGGLSRFSRKKGTWMREDVPEAATVVTKIFDIDRQGTFLWMATSDAGIWRYSLKDGSWTVYKKGSGMLADGTYTLAVNGDDVWVGTHYCLMRYSGKADAWLNIVKPGEHEFFDITALAPDEGTLWYGTFRKGIGRVDTRTARWIDVPDGLTRNAVTALCTAGDTLWTGFGYDEGCMDRFDRNSLAWLGNVNRYEGMDGLQVACIARTGGTLLAGTWAGLYVRRGASWRSLTTDDGLPDDDIACLVPVDGGAWVGTGRGLAFYDTGTGGVWVDPRVPAERVTAVAVDADDGVWTGRFDGGIRFVADGADTCIPYLEGNRGAITALTWWDGAVWAGTAGGGLIRMEPEGGDWIRYTRPAGVLRRFRSGPVHGRVNALCVVDAGRLWAATDAGISIIDTSGAWTALTAYDGLYANEVTGLFVDDEYVWAGHYGGFTRIRIDDAHPYDSGRR